MVPRMVRSPCSFVSDKKLTSHYAGGITRGWSSLCWPTDGGVAGALCCRKTSLYLCYLEACTHKDYKKGRKTRHHHQHYGACGHGCFPPPACSQLRPSTQHVVRCATPSSRASPKPPKPASLARHRQVEVPPANASSRAILQDRTLLTGASDARIRGLTHVFTGVREG